MALRKSVIAMAIYTNVDFLVCLIKCTEYLIPVASSDVRMLSDMRHRKRPLMAASVDLDGYSFMPFWL